MWSDIYKNDAEILIDLRAKVRKDERILPFIGRGENFPSIFNGHTVMDVLPHLIGLPLNDLIFAWLPAVSPTRVRISYGEVTTDAWPGRVTIILNRYKLIESITQEVYVALGSGSNIDTVTKEAREEVRLGTTASRQVS